MWRPVELLDSPANRRELDVVAAWIHPLALRLSEGPFGAALAGRNVGHPMHPALATLPLGFGSAAAVMSLVPGQGRSVRSLLVATMLSTPVAVASGLVEFETLGRYGRRVAVTHVALNSVGLGLQTHALIRRQRGSLWFGLAVSYVAAAFGGHVAFRFRSKLQQHAE